MTLEVCVCCNTGMITVEPNQITHPCCDPDDTALPILSVEEISELIGNLGRCQDCGEPTREPGSTPRCRPNHKVTK